MFSKHDRTVECSVSSKSVSTKTDLDTLTGISGASLTTATATPMDLVQTATHGTTTSPLPQSSHKSQKVFSSAQNLSRKMKRVNDEIDLQASAEASEHERQEKYVRFMLLFALACFAVLLVISNIGTYVYAQHVAESSCRRTMFSGSVHTARNSTPALNETTTENLHDEGDVIR